MANTTLLKTVVEPYVRQWLTRRCGTAFEEHEVPLELITGGTHWFDAVSKDRRIIAGIKASAARETGKVGVGVIKSAYTELYFLSLVKAPKKYLVLTDQRFHEIMSQESKNKVLPDTEILFCPLPNDVASAIARVNKTAREEIGKKERTIGS